ncbi:MAG: DUF2075 domain-containing protein [Firmicutes bacterium]|nr:DUF2075 domain-containing protein [Bacillota bacterium]
MKAYYSADIKDFRSEEVALITDKITAEYSRNFRRLEKEQVRVWEYEINHLKTVLQKFDGRVLFEYSIPRIGRRIDAVLLIKGIVFVLEYKDTESSFLRSSIDQVHDYALDLKNFQKESHDKLIVPILIVTRNKQIINNEITVQSDRVVDPIKCNSSNLEIIINEVCLKFANEAVFDYIAWEDSRYSPTPTIVEAAQALFSDHKVEEISNSEGKENLTLTTDVINNIIEKTKQNNEKAVIFVTGVPGAGKTLVGLKLVSSRKHLTTEENAIYISGNGPLVEVLKAALSRDRVRRNKDTKYSAVSRSIDSFILDAYHYRRDCLKHPNEAPNERVVVFDEAQRVWTEDKLKSYLKKNNGNDIDQSEPEFFLGVIGKHQGWAAIVCLVGEGQEIHTGEAGINEWFKALKDRNDWHIYIPNEKKEFITEYGLSNISPEKNLHLSVSARSFRGVKLAELVDCILNGNLEKASSVFKELNSQKQEQRYPIYLTRDLANAKRKIKEMARGTERFGMIASSKAKRLRAEGVFVPESNPKSSFFEGVHWFLNNKEDIRSSYMLELVASEFKIQGLELDYTIVAWDADYRYNDKEKVWVSNELKTDRKTGTTWQVINNSMLQNYLKNSYRVLLTRARQGMIIFIPTGDDQDLSRKREFYDSTYNFLLNIGFELI